MFDRKRERMCVCVCVCVCERREREKECGRERVCERERKIRLCVSLCVRVCVRKRPWSGRWNPPRSTSLLWCSPAQHRTHCERVSLSSGLALVSHLARCSYWGTGGSLRRRLCRPAASGCWRGRGAPPPRRTTRTRCWPSRSRPLGVGWTSADLEEKSK